MWIRGKKRMSIEPADVRRDGTPLSIGHVRLSETLMCQEKRSEEMIGGLSHTLHEDVASGKCLVPRMTMIVLRHS